MDQMLIFVGAYFVGLGLNLTPCVYPMLAITASLFGSRLAGDLPGIRFQKALIYVLGMATMYSVLGVFASFTGAFFGAALQNKWVLLLIALVLFLMSLSMFGIYSLQAPAWLLEKVSPKKAAGFLSFYFSGLFVGLFAAPCIGPPIIALLTVVGAKGNPFFAFFLFFIMSFGLGTPYLIFGTYADLIKTLPKSGVWLIWVERLFGFVLLMLSLFYLLLAVGPELAASLPPVALMTGGIFLGWVEKSGDEIRFFKAAKRILGVLTLAAGIMLVTAAPKETVSWQSYSPELIETAKSSRQPVVIDFYADWCIPCLEMERFVYPRPAIKEKLEKFLRIKVDLTDPGPAEGFLVEKYRVLGVPTIIFLDGEGREIETVRITGFADAGELLEILNEITPPASAS